MIKCLNSNISYAFCALFWKYWFMRSWIHWILFLCTLYATSQVSWNWGCIMCVSAICVHIVLWGRWCLRPYKSVIPVWYSRRRVQGFQNPRWEWCLLQFSLSPQGCQEPLAKLKCGKKMRHILLFILIDSWAETCLAL